MDFSSLFSSSSILFSVVCVAAVAFWKWNNSSTPSSPPPVKVPLVSPILKKKEKPKDSKEDIIARGLIPVKIFYASQTGTAEDFSHKIASEAKRYKFHPTVVDLEDYEKSELGSEGFAIFLIATYGEGEPTDNSREFYEWLKDDSLDSELLKGLKFTVFGLGNKTYEHYNEMGRFFDKRLEELGAERIFQRGEGDDDASLEDDFAAWKKELWPQLVTHFKIEVPVGSADNETERRYKVKTYAEDSAVAKTSKNNTHKHLAKRDTNTTYSIKNPYIAKVLENKELHSPGSDRSCRHVEIDIGKALTYEPGDHLGIYPENDPSLVEQLGKRLEQDLDVVFALYPVDNETKPYLGPCTYRQAFLQWSDLTSPPRKTVLKVFAELATDPKEKKRLELLSDAEKQQPYAKWIKDEMRTVLEILNEFPSVKIPADHLIEILPRLAPRYYSISSSLQANPGRVHITCVLVDFETPTKRRHKGVCSHWLNKQIPNQESSPSVYVFMEEAKFRLPKDPAIPTIMIGPGTGVAPFRGFIQERNLLHQKGTVTENFLFFGCRSSDLDFLYKDELLTYEKNGLLKLSTAFSRETEQKVYVQHKISERKEELWELLHNKKGCFYICGDARSMAKDVNQALRTLIMEKLEKTEEEANQYVADLQKDGRYFTDVWF